MKKVFVLLSLVGFLFAGCQPESTLTGPAENSKKLTTWIEMPQSQNMSVERSHFTFNVINGSNGGSVTLQRSYNSSNGEVNVSADLTVPAGAYSGWKIIRYLVNDNSAVCDFGPSMNFNVPLLFDLSLSGIDLSDVTDPNQVTFAYMAEDGSIQPAEYESATVDVANGKLEVRGAKLNHFSRYGWAK